MVTPGNEMKWDTTEPGNGSYNFGPGDAIVNFATAHSMRVRGHNLVWHSQLPSWVNSLPVSQVKAAMEAHITTEVNHYKGKIYAWDVVNEPFNEDGSYRQDAFYKAFGGGAAYIADAIRTAHAADPSAKLYVNDYNVEGQNAKSNALYSLAQTLLSQGVPLSGIGLESHFIVGQVPSSLQANMQRFAALGLDVAVTELDDRIPLPASSGNLNQQGTDYGNVVKACLAVSRCVGVSQWGVDDGHSWIDGTFPGYGAATMYDRNYQPKAAYNASVSALGGSGSGGSGGIVSGSVYSLTNAASGRSLDEPGGQTANGTLLQVWDSNGGTNQQWRASLNGDGTYTLTNTASGRALDEPGSQTANGTRIEVWDSNGGANQHWRASQNSDGSYTLVNVASGRALETPGGQTANGTQVQVWDSTGGSNQHWTFR